MTNWCSECSVDLDVPEVLLLNDDDDNGNGVADYAESGAVAGENDLIPVSITMTGCPVGCDPAAGYVEWHICELGGNRHYTVYFWGDRTGPINHSMEAGWPVAGEFYFEGIKAFACPAPLYFWFNYGGCCWDTGGVITVAGLKSLEWEKLHFGSPDLDDCPNNGGKRIFPGKVSPTDGLGFIRKQVNLVATIEPHTAGVTVYFQVWDVDDPFDQANAGMPNVNLIDDDTDGSDNRGPEPQSLPWPTSAVTNATGRATVTFTVSMQPGDNYRAAASLHQGVFDLDFPQATSGMADAKYTDHGNDGSWSGYEVPAVWSEMLTVWRKLHVETDTMVRPTFVQNTWTMSWNEPRQGPAATQVVFDVDDPPVGGGHTNDEQFTNGYVQLQDPTGNTIVTAKIVGYETFEFGFDPDDEVKINIPDCGNGQSGLACLGGVTSGTAILSDDDLSDQPTFTAKVWGCNDLYSGPVASVLPPDLSALQLRYHPAYIDPVQDMPTSNVQGLVTFLSNWNESDNNGKALWDQCLVARDLPVSTSGFWTVMVVSAWQAEENQDGDPNSEDQVGIGMTKGVNTHPESAFGNTATQSNISGIGDYTGVCAVFKAVFGETSYVDYERFTVVHEIGHTFGLDHRDGGAMCEKGDCQREPFQAVELRELRNYVQP